jgi:hypothetical protein
VGDIVTEGLYSYNFGIWDSKNAIEVARKQTEGLLGTQKIRITLEVFRGKKTIYDIAQDTSLS